jgi:hypothetical protein
VSESDDDMGTYMMSVHTKAQELLANRAYELLHMSGYPSITEAIHLVEDGNLAYMPALIREDIKRAYKRNEETG